MSGEKAHSARVVSAEELRRRAVESARARCAALQARLATLADVVEGMAISNADLSAQSLDSLRNLASLSKQGVDNYYGENRILATETTLPLYEY